MTVERNIVAIIPARGGSKGLPRKNVLPLAGKPLIAHTILHAKQAKYIRDVFVSTEDDEIADTALSFGAQVIRRPHTLAMDMTSSEDVLLHALETLEKTNNSPDLIAFLQCTSPVREPCAVDQAIVQFYQESADSLLSVCAHHRFLWKNDEGAESLNYDYRARPRRQDMGRQYVENGSLYLFKPSILKQYRNRLGGRISLYVMPEWCQMEIDSAFDMALIEAFLQNTQESVNYDY